MTTNDRASTAITDNPDGAVMAHLRSDDWVVQSCPHSMAVGLIKRQHYAKGAPNTGTYIHGLFRSNCWPLVADIMGAALWIPPTRTAAESVAGDDWQGVLCLSRLVIHPDVPTNGASFLLGRSMQMIDRDRWPYLLTYADTGQGHTGAIYKATNWTELGCGPASDTWTMPDGQQVGRKRGGRTLLAAELEAVGAVRQMSQKVKFVHVAGGAK